MEAERQIMIQALRDGKGNPFLNQKIFRIAKNKALAFQSYQEASEHYNKDPHSSKLHFEVWRDFSASISNAPHNSEEEALGYAGRSLILHHMKKYEECLRDIERGLKIAKYNATKTELFALKASCHAELDQPEKTVALEKAEFYLKKVKIDHGRLELISSVNQAKKDVKKVKAMEPDDAKNKAKTKIVKMFKRKETEDPFESVDIRYDDKYGRHLVAKKDFKAGEIICVQKPYAISTNTDFLPFAFCCHCMCISWDAVPCISCGWAMFCSEKCREEAYTQYHDIECDVMPRVRDMDVPDIFKQLTIRTVILAVRECGGLTGLKEEIEKIEKCTDKRTKGFADNGKFDGSKFRSVYSLAHEVSEEMLMLHIDDSIKVLFAFINCSSFFGKKKYKTISELIKDQDMMFVASFILRLIKIFNISYHGLFEDNILCEKNHQREECARIHCCYRGMTITPLFGLVNHSCMPNVMICFTDAGNSVLYAVRPIKKDEQLFVKYNYCFYEAEKWKRKVMLAKNYNFTCDCKACLQNWPIAEIMDQEKEVKLPNVSKKHTISSEKLDDIQKLIHDAALHEETHSWKQIQELGKAMSLAMKNYAEPSFIICALMNAVERVSYDVYFTELIDEIKSISFKESQ